VAGDANIASRCSRGGASLWTEIVLGWRITLAAETVENAVQVVGGEVVVGGSVAGGI
jgi:hypothetical protein